MKYEDSTAHNDVTYVLHPHDFLPAREDVRTTQKAADRCGMRRQPPSRVVLHKDFTMGRFLGPHARLVL